MGAKWQLCGADSLFHQINVQMYQTQMGGKKEVVSVFFCSLLLLVKFQNKSSKNCLVYMQKQEKMELSRCSRSVILKSYFATPNVHRDKGTVKVRVLSSQTAFVFLLAIRWSL